MAAEWKRSGSGAEAERKRSGSGTGAEAGAEAKRNSEYIPGPQGTIPGPQGTIADLRVLVLVLVLQPKCRAELVLGVTIRRN